MSFRATVPAASALIGLLVSFPPPAAGVDGDNFNVYVDLASDYVLRGYSQTNANPAFQAGVDFEDESGIFSGLRLSNVEFPSVGGFEDERELEFNLYFGYGLDLGRRWAVSSSLVHYEYFGDQSAIDWDYTEIRAALHSGRAALALAYSDSALGSGDRGLAVELTDGWRLPNDFELGAGIGFYDLDAPFLQDYTYWNVTLSRPIHRFLLSLGYFDTDDRGEVMWGDLAEARVVAGASYLIN